MRSRTALSVVFAICAGAGLAAAQNGSLTGTEVAQFHKNAPLTNNRFGRDILLDHDTALVMWGSTTSSYSLSCFVHSATGWTHKPSPFFAASGFTQSFEGDLCLQGFPSYLGTSGRVAVWRRSGSTWTQSWLLAPDVGQPPEAFGVSTDIDGSTVVIGNSSHTENYANEGALYVYEDTGAALVLRQSFYGEVPGAQLGTEVRVSGDDMLVYYHTSPTTFGIHAYRRQGGVWIRTQPDIAPSAPLNGGLQLDHGVAVARLAGGAFSVFANPGNGWFLDQTVPVVPGVFTGAYDFEIDDGVIAASDPGADFADVDAGAAYLFARNDGWKLQATLTASDAQTTDYFGYGIALQGSRLLVGAPNADHTATDGGVVYEFALTHSPAHVYCVPEQATLGCIARMGFSGVPSASSGLPFAITASGVLSHKTGVLVYGTNGRTFTPYPGGVRCIAAPRSTTARQTSGGTPGTSDCSGALAVDFNALIASGADPALYAGRVVDAQWIYRDPLGPSALASSEAIEFTILP